MQPFIIKILTVVIQFAMIQALFASEPSMRSLEDEDDLPSSVRELLALPYKGHVLPVVDDIPSIKNSCLSIAYSSEHSSHTSLLKPLSSEFQKKAKQYERGDLDTLIGPRSNPRAWLQATIFDFSIQVSRIQKLVQTLQAENQEKERTLAVFNQLMKNKIALLVSDPSVLSTSTTSSGSWYKTPFQWMWGANPKKVTDEEVLDYCIGLHIINSFLNRPELKDKENMFSRSYHRVRDTYARGHRSILLEVRPGEFLRIKERERHSDITFKEIRKQIIVEGIGSRFLQQKPEAYLLELDNAIEEVKVRLFTHLHKKNKIRERLSREKDSQELQFDLKKLDEKILNYASYIRKLTNAWLFLNEADLESLKTELQELIVRKTNHTSKVVADKQYQKKTYAELLLQLEDIQKRLSVTNSELKEAGFKMPTDATINSFEVLVNQDSNEVSREQEEPLSLLVTSERDVNLAATSLELKKPEVMLVSRTVESTIKDLRPESYLLLFSTNQEANKLVKKIPQGTPWLTIKTWVSELVPNLISKFYEDFCIDKIFLLGLQPKEAFALTDTLITTYDSMIMGTHACRFDLGAWCLKFHPVKILDLCKIARRNKKLENFNSKNAEEWLNKLQTKIAQAQQDKENLIKPLSVLEEELTFIKQGVKERKTELVQQHSEKQQGKMNLCLAEALSLKRKQLETEAQGSRKRHEAFIAVSARISKLEAGRKRLESQIAALAKTLLRKEIKYESLSELLKLEQSRVNLERELHTARAEIPTNDEENSNCETAIAGLDDSLRKKKYEIDDLKCSLFKQSTFEPVKEALRSMSVLSQQRLRVKLPSAAEEKYLYLGYGDNSYVKAESIIFHSYVEVFKKDFSAQNSIKEVPEKRELWFMLNLAEPLNPSDIKSNPSQVLDNSGIKAASHKAAAQADTSLVLASENASEVPEASDQTRERKINRQEVIFSVHINQESKDGNALKLEAMNVSTKNNASQLASKKEEPEDGFILVNQGENNEALSNEEGSQAPQKPGTENSHNSAPLAAL